MKEDVICYLWVLVNETLFVVGGKKAANDRMIGAKIDFLNTEIEVKTAEIYRLGKFIEGKTRHIKQDILNKTY